jgi:RIO kinase 1
MVSLLDKSKEALEPCCSVPRHKLYKFEKKMALDRRKQRRLEQDIDDFKIFSEVFDTSTLMSIYHMLNTGKILAVHGCIKMGKEACIHLAEAKRGVVILKIYRIATSDFRSMWQYLQGDPRFRNIGGNRREVIYTWTSREYRNLVTAQKSGCLCPRPIAVEKNLILMQCVKRKRLPAPRMIDVSLEEPEPVFESILESYRNLYQKGGLVHGDLSPYNILIGDKGPVLIDFSQGTVKEGPKATNLLFRDVETLTPYFVKRGVEVDNVELTERISGIEGISPDETVII